jgi:hypothetical protein
MPNCYRSIYYGNRFAAKIFDETGRIRGSTIINSG